MPFGCVRRGAVARFTWWHVQFGCGGLAEARLAWLADLRRPPRRLRTLRGVPHRELSRALAAGRSGEAWEEGVCYADEAEVEMRRVAGGRGGSGSGVAGRKWRVS